MSDFPVCPKCEQQAVYPHLEDDGEENFICAACGHVTYPSWEVREQARDALRSIRGGVPAFTEHWKKKLADERAKVARLAEGRW